MDDAKTPVTRKALERVLARAVELQSAGGEGSESDAMSEAQLIDIGKEVGLSPDNVRQALAEERARGEVSDAPAGFRETVFGRSQIAAQRVVPGAPDAVMAALDRWMQNEEWLRVKRQQRDRIVWEPRRDFMGGLRRAFGGRPHSLHSASEVAATVAGVDGARTVIALSADLASAQRSLLGQLIAAVTVSSAASGALAMMGFMEIVVFVPLAVVVSASTYGAFRAMARTRERVQVGLEQVLDRLEQRSVETRPPSLLQMIDSALPRLR